MSHVATSLPIGTCEGSRSRARDATVACCVMSTDSEPELLVLHALRLKSLADAAEVSELFGTELEMSAGILRRGENAGLLRRHEGVRAGWMLTDEGRDYAQGLLAKEVAASGSSLLVEDAYQRFLSLNQGFLQLCTDWQVSDLDAGVLNDHTDAEHDAAIVARLSEFHRQVIEICDDLTGALTRFGRYRPALTRAHDRVLGADTDWFTKPTIESYHTLWFELHEDLLATLGIERAKEQR